MTENEIIKVIECLLGGEIDTASCNWDPGVERLEKLISIMKRFYIKINMKINDLAWDLKDAQTGRLAKARKLCDEYLDLVAGKEE